MAGGGGRDRPNDRSFFGVYSDMFLLLERTSVIALCRYGPLVRESCFARGSNSNIQPQPLFKCFLSIYNLAVPNFVSLLF